MRKGLSKPLAIVMAFVLAGVVILALAALMDVQIGRLIDFGNNNTGGIGR